MKSPANVAFGKALRAIRTSRGMSQYGLADEADLDRSYISLLERGLRSPTLETMCSLARGLNVSVGDMIAVFETVIGTR